MFASLIAWRPELFILKWCPHKKLMPHRRNVPPMEIFNDNWGNSVATEKELGKSVKWHFNPLKASDQVGFYRVFFEIFPQIFQSVVKESPLTEFDLITYVAKIERIINHRPITSLICLNPNGPGCHSRADDWSLSEFLKAGAFDMLEQRLNIWQLNFGISRRHYI